MASRLGFAIVLLTAATLCAQETHKESNLLERIQQRYSVIDSSGRAIPYLVYVPSSYDPAREWPMILGLHGTAGYPQQILDIPRLVELAEERGYLVVCPASSGWYGSSWLSRKPSALTVRSDLHISDVLERTLEEFSIDQERMYLLGVSLGGAGAWHLAFSEPERWAAIAPITPASYHGTRDLEPIGHVGVIMIQGEKDTAVSVGANRRIVEHMARMEMDHRYIEIPDAGHDLSDHDVMSEVFSFFETRSRR